MQGLGIWLAVAGGGAIGATLRYAVSRITLRFVGTDFLWPTLFVNVAGSFVMGLLIAWLAAKEPQGQVFRAFATVGILGAFTTFSTFSFDMVTLFERKAYAAAGGYLTASVIFSVCGLGVGLLIGRAVT